MVKKGEKVSRSVMDSAPPANAEEFAASLKRRRQAAHGLEQDLLTEAPLLYGSPGQAPHGDPGIILAQVHRDELLRRNGGGVLQASSRRSDVALPFEGTVTVVAILLFLFFLFGE